MRIMWRTCGLAALMAAGLIVTNGAPLASDSPVVHVKAVVQDGTVRLEAKANGPFEYTSYRPSESLYVVDMKGVSAADPTGDRVVASDVVKGYRESTYSVGQKPMVRLEILLSKGLDPRLERADAQNLAILVSRTETAAAAPTSAMLKPVAAKSEAGSAAPVVRAIQQVALSQEEERTQVSVVGSGPLRYHSTRLQNPDRVVLDFESSHLRTSTKHIASNLDPVRDIRVAQFTPDVSRVVIDLRQPAQYEIAATANGIKVTFAAHAGAVKSVPASEPSNLLTATNDAPKLPIPEQPAAIPAPVVSLPAPLTQNTSALAHQQEQAPAPQQTQAPAAPQQEQAAPQTPNPATPAATTSPEPQSTEPAPTAAMPAPSTSAPSPAAPAMAPAAKPESQLAAGGMKYSGEPISVNLKEVDLRDFFRLIHEISGLNVVVDPNVKGTLTIVLDDVPWDQALDIVLRNNDLDKQLDGNVLRIATKMTVKKEAEETRDLAKAQAEAADVVTTTRVLSYAKAADMSATLKKFLSSRGEILADDRSNTLIIRDVPSVLPVIDNLLRQLDRKSRQVEIEARVVAANRSFNREFGVLIGGSGRAGNNGIGGSGLVGAGNTTFATPPPISVGTGSVPLVTNLGATVPTSGITYVFQSTNVALDMVLDAMEQKGVGKLLSKPKIITQNNQKATVKQGTKIPVQTIINNTVSVQFVDAVLQLEVTPQITAEGTIFMDVTVTNDQIDQSIPRVEGIPAIDTQSAQTRVTVNDGATVVVGGVIVSQQRTDVQQVPVLGSVPLIGNLFRHSTVSSQAQELLFFLTPRLLPG